METNKITPFIETHPGEVLLDELKSRKLKQKTFAKDSGIPITMLNEIIKGKRSITADIALVLEKTLDIESNYWLNLQSNYELDKAKAKAKNIKKFELIEFWKIIKNYIPIKSFEKYGVLTGFPELDIPKLKTIYSFQNIDDLINILTTRKFAYYKKSDKLKINDINLLGWSNLVIHLASNSSVKSFDINCKENLISSLKLIFIENVNTIEKVKKCLSDFGIKFIVAEKFEQTPVDGFSFWKGDNPSIAITTRHKKLDNLIFTIMHELGHIFLHLINDKNNEYLDFESNIDKSTDELQANEFAKNNLIPKNMWIEFLQSNAVITDIAIINFAQIANVHPSTVFGRYCFEKNTYNIKTSIDRVIR